MDSNPQELDIRAEHRSFGGVQGFYTHQSRETGGAMRFALYLPPSAAKGPVPVLYFLSGLTCTEETFTIKAGAQRFAAHHGVALAAPDTSPRDAGVPGENDDWDLGTGAGFYVDAMQPPWSDRYRMYSYVVDELPALIGRHFPVDTSRQGIFGHSMGGHGALMIALRNPDRYRSVSAFAPIAAPSRVPWGRKAFGAYLGAATESWKAYDACELVAGSTFPHAILVDQGLADPFLDEQLRPDLLEQAARQSGQMLTLRRHAEYDHSYYFIASFIEDHLHHHAQALNPG